MGGRRRQRQFHQGRLPFRGGLIQNRRAQNRHGHLQNRCGQLQIRVGQLQLCRGPLCERLATSGVWSWREEWRASVDSVNFSVYVDVVNFSALLPHGIHMTALYLPPSVVGLAVALGISATNARAQSTQPADTSSAHQTELLQALAAVRSCTELGAANRAPQAKAEGARAEALLGRYLGRQPRDPDALVALARTVSQCLLPAAQFAEQGELSARAIELLEQAVETEPTHWTARFVLASIMFRSPSFLGRATRAARELDILLSQQGERTDNPMFARVYELRGLLYVRGGQVDSASAVWVRGAVLFPSDTALARLAPQIAIPVHDQPSGTVSLEAIRVVARSLPSATAAPTPSVQMISKSQVLMAAGGTADVMQAVQMQPGATRVTEGSDIYTRGGDASETALMINGGRVLTLSRFEGLNGSMFGAIEPFLVRWLRYSSGGFSVRHGNALSGVLEIETEGRPRERQLRAGASLVQVSGTARLPISGAVGAWISARVSHTGALLAMHGRSAEFDGAPHSQEMIASLVASPTSMSEVRATTIVARDDSRRMLSTAGWSGAFHSAGESRTVQLSSRWSFASTPIVLRANVTGSSRTSDWKFGVLAREREDAALVSRVDAEWSPSAAMTVRGGVEQASLTRAERGTVPTTASVAPGAPSREALAEQGSAQGLGAYLETEHVRGAATLTLGLRADRLPGEGQTTLDPRGALAIRAGQWTARLSGGVFHQGRHRATPVIPDAGRPSDVARVATHLVAGIEREGVMTTFRAEAFMKEYGDYVAHGVGPRSTAGTARGIDFVMRTTTGGSLTGWMGYSLLDATVRLVDGETVRSSLDVTHSATASATMSLGGDWSLGSTVRYGTGAPITPVIGGEERDGRLVPSYGDIMSDRLPAYGRFDARLTRFLRASRFLLTTYVEVLNVTDRRNVASMSYDAEYRRREPVNTFFANRTMVAGGEFQFR